MTTIQRWVLTCDWPQGCADTYCGSKTVAETMAGARDLGWKRIRKGLRHWAYLDYCPAHAGRSGQ